MLWFAWAQHSDNESQRSCLAFSVASRCTKPPTSLIIGQVSRCETHFNAENLVRLRGWCTISIRHRCVFKKLVSSELWAWNPVVMTPFFCAVEPSGFMYACANKYTYCGFHLLFETADKDGAAWERFKSVPLHLTFINHVLFCFANLSIWLPMIY